MRVKIEFGWCGGTRKWVDLYWQTEEGLHQQTTMWVPEDFLFDNQKDRRALAKRFKKQTGLQGKSIHFR